MFIRWDYPTTTTTTTTIKDCVGKYFWWRMKPFTVHVAILQNGFFTNAGIYSICKCFTYWVLSFTDINTNGTYDWNLQMSKHWGL